MNLKRDVKTGNWKQKFKPSTLHCRICYSLLQIFCKMSQVIRVFCAKKSILCTAYIHNKRSKNNMQVCCSEHLCERESPVMLCACLHLCGRLQHVPSGNSDKTVEHETGRAERMWFRLQLGIGGLIGFIHQFDLPIQHFGRY